MLNLNVKPINTVAIVSPIKPLPGLVVEAELFALYPKPLPGIVYHDDL